jgi:leader peptidase (prepilin peptidase) / N-methyltransferase
MSETLLRVLIAVPFGLVIGSFMTVVVARLPAGKSVVRPRSLCPGCGTAIRSRDNIPVVSWLLLLGRCRECGTRISIEYPVLELLTAGLVVGAIIEYPSLWVAIIVASLMAMTPAIALIDIRHRIIPNKLMYPSLIAFPVFVLVAWFFHGGTDALRSLAGFLLYGGGLLLVALISRGMGMGDVKLASLIGIVMGAIGLRFVGVAAAAAIVLGGLGAIVALLLGRERKSAIPFGPYLAAGAVVAAFLTEPIASWYLQRFLVS